MLSRLAQGWLPSGMDPLAVAMTARREAELPTYDLINIPACMAGISFPERTFAAALDRAIRQKDLLREYDPDPQGDRTSRIRVAENYARRGIAVDPEHIFLIPGTSMGYEAVLRCLLNRGEEMLIPAPGYPLFDDLAAMAGVGTRAYHLRHEVGRWMLDAEEVAFQQTPRTRLLAVVSPHNPTGCVLDAEAWGAIAAHCQHLGLPLVIDEVFVAFAESAPIPSLEAAPLTILLNGLSKSHSLPQWKLAWIAVGGSDRALVSALCQALAHYLDGYLAMPELHQVLLGELLIEQEAANAVAEKTNKRRAELRALFMKNRALLSDDAGSYLVLRTACEDDRSIALTLLREDGIAVHPGSYYGLPGSIVTTIYGPDHGYRHLAELINKSLI